MVTASYDKTVRVWDAATGHELLRLVGHTDAVNGAAFSPDGQRVASVARDGTLRVWDAQTGEQRSKLAGESGNLLSADFSPDGQRVVTAGQDGIARVGTVYSARFRPDGQRVVTASQDGTARVWDAGVTNSSRQLLGHMSTIRTAAEGPPHTACGHPAASMKNDRH